MNKVQRRRRWQNLWRSTVCGCLMVPSSSVKALVTISSVPSDALASLCQNGTGAVTPFQAPGQPYQIGLSLMIPAASAESIEPDMSSQFRRGPSTTPDQSSTPGNVDILVVDDFNFVGVDVQVAGGQTRSVNLSHGHLVIAHIRALLEKAYYSLMPSDRLNVLSYRSDHGTGPRVVNVLRKDVMSVSPPASPFASLPSPPSPNFNLQPWQMSGSGTPILIPGNPGSSTFPLPIPPITNPFPTPGTNPSPSFPRQLPGSVRPGGGFPQISLAEVIVPPRNLERSLNEYFSRPINFTLPGKPGFIPTAPFITPTEPDKTPIQPKADRAPNVILNLSLSVFNCSMLEEFSKYLGDRQGVGTLPEFVKYYAEEKKLSEQEVMGQLTNVPTDSPFSKFLNEEMARGIFDSRVHTLAVAASGNYGLNYSTSPGSLSNVISVGARTSDWKQPGPPNWPTYWSNRADVLAVGVGFTLSRKQLQGYCDVGRTCIADDIEPNTILSDIYQKFIYSGTSFAAPSVSAFLATRIGDNPCFNNARPFGFKPLLNKKSQKFEFRGDWIYQSCDPIMPLIGPLKPAS